VVFDVALPQQRIVTDGSTYFRRLYKHECGFLKWHGGCRS
jgi:hypothetical protein